MRAFILLAIAVSGLGLQGCKEKCEVPAGTYQMAFKSLTGDCPKETVAQFEEFSDTVEIPTERACQKFVTNISTDVETCRISMDISADASNQGLKDGQGVFTMLCDGGAQCRQTFGVDFKKLPAK